MHHSITGALRRHRIALFSSVLLLLAATRVAEASRRGSRGGRLGSTVSGIRGSGGSRGGSPSRASHGHRRIGHARHAPLGVGIWAQSAGGGPSLVQPVIDLYGGLQRVVESDGSAIGELRIELTRIALLGRFSGYRESVGPDMEPIRLDLWSAGVGFELTSGSNSRLWLEVLASGIRTFPTDKRAGAAAGIRAEHRLDSTFSLSAAARRYAFSGDVNANEAVVGIQASVLRASYRILDFDVGPALRGPEVGIAVRF